MFSRAPGPPRGVVLPLVAVGLTALLGFGGLVIDLGSLFVAKTELQSALDSCALAAAQELDGAADALSRATNAGLTAGNFNKVGYQETTAGITTEEVTFSDTLAGSYSTSFAPAANARYARCNHTTNGIPAYLIQLVGGSTSNSVGAVAVATRAHAQSSCPLPIGIRPKPGGTAPNYGYLVGEWITMLYDPTQSGQPSEMGWYNLDGSTNAAETQKEVAGTGYCGSKVGDTVGTPGAKVAVSDEWNSRFGIYKNNGDMAAMRPDFTGYVYCQSATNPSCTETNWANPVPQNAYSGTPTAGSHATAANFLTKRLAYANYADTGTTINEGDAITGLNLKPGGFKDLATAGTSGQHREYGKNRRVVLVSVVSPASKIIDYACMLMLQPVTNTTVAVQLEFLGNAGDPGTPCTTNGLAGGAAGPMVPTLVQ